MMGRTLRCPKCKSTNIEPLGSSKKSLSVGKAVVGGVLLGPLGAAGGAMLGKKGKTTMFCRDCGYTWKIKV